MPLEFLSSDVQVGFSHLPETAINTPFILSADFDSGLVHQFPPIIPGAENADDGDMIGRGDEFPSKVWLYRWAQNGYTFTGKLNTEMAAVMFLRFLGGTITNAVVGATTAYDHSVVQQTKAQGRQPKLTTMYLPVGGADFIFSSMAVNSFSIQGANDDIPTFSYDVVGTGHHQRHRDLGTPIVLPAVPTYHYPHGAAVVLTLNDGSLQNLSSLGRVRSYAVSGTNNIKVGDRRIGDPFLTPGNYNSGSYARFLNRQKRSATAQIKVSLDENLNEYGWLKNGTVITSFSIKCIADQIGATANNYEFEWKIPNMKLQVIDGDQEGDDATTTLNFLPLRDGVSGGLITGRIRDTNTTLV